MVQSSALLPDDIRARELLDKLTESMGTQRLPGSGTYAFRFMSPVPILVPPNSQIVALPAGYFDKDGPGYQATSYYVVNPNSCYVRLAGSSTDTPASVTLTTGRLFPPNFAGVFSTLYPKTMMAMAVRKGGIAVPAELDPLEIFYGGGT